MRILVQHHPARAQLLPGLRAALGEPVEVVTDPDPNAKLKSPWRTYEQCLLLLGDDPGIVVQDDASPCRAFRETAGAAITARPDRLIAFFHGGLPDMRLAARRAHDLGEAFLEIIGNSFVPTVALYWPPGEAAAFLTYLQARPRGLPRYQRMDDSLVGEWVRKKRKGALVTVPSLVEHPDVEPSLIGARARAGRAPARVAALYVGDDPTRFTSRLH